MKKSDFRVKEYDGMFSIERKKIVTDDIVYNWCKGSTTKTIWQPVDNYGEFISSISAPQIEVFNDLKSAIEKIDTIIEGVKYHYFN